MPTIAEIWGLQIALDNKALANHQHRIVEIEGLAAALAAAASIGNNAAFIGDISGLQDALDSKASIDALTGLQTQINAKATTAALNSATDSLQAQIATLSGAIGTGTTAIANVTGLQTALDAKAAAAHTHAIADVTGLQTALDAKAAAAHTHSNASSSVAGFMSAADKVKLDGLSGSGSSFTDNVSPTEFSYTASQSSVYGGATGTFANLTDGSFTTGAGTDGAGTVQWIQADLGSSKVINRIRLGGGTLPVWGAIASYINNSAYLEFSNDGSTWATLIQLIQGISDSASRLYGFSPFTARYIRIVKYTATNTYVGLGEFRIYG